MAREYYPYTDETRRKDEDKWAAIAYISNCISRLREEGKDITYENLQGLPARTRAMIRHYYLQDGKIYYD